MKNFRIGIALTLFLLIFTLPVAAKEFKLQATELGLIEQTLLNQAINNDLEVKQIDKELNKAGLVRDIGSLIATTNMISVRVLNLSHFGIDMSARFVTNSLQLGSDAINISTLGYKIYRGKKIKQKLEKRVNEITKDILNAFSRLNNSFDDSGAKNLLVSYVGEKSVNDYLQWITNRTSQRE